VRQLESKAEHDTKERAQMELGVECIKLKARSWPDKMFMIPGGRPFLIEFKRKNEVLRKNQQLKVWRLEKLGYDVEVHDSTEEAVEAIRIRVLEAAQVPRKGSKVCALESSNSVASRSRNGQNSDFIRRVQGVEEQRRIQGSAGGSASPSSNQRVAEGAAKVDRVPRTDRRRTAR
jgi:hypothetical protein